MWVCEKSSGSTDNLKSISLANSVPHQESVALRMATGQIKRFERLTCHPSRESKLRTSILVQKSPMTDKAVTVG